MLPGNPSDPQPPAESGPGAEDPHVARLGSQGPLGHELGLLVAQRVLPSLIEVATEVAAELSRLSTGLGEQRAGAERGRWDLPGVAIDWVAIDAARAAVEQRFTDAGAWLAVIAAGLGAEVGNRRLVTRLLDSLEVVLERALPGQRYRHSPEFAWPALASGQGQSFEAPLALLTTLLVAEAAAPGGQTPRILRAKPLAGGFQLELPLATAIAPEGRQMLEAWRARLPQIVPGADLELIPAEPGEAQPQAAGSAAAPADLLRLDLPPGWLV
jgi:hypothetical protein